MGHIFIFLNSNNSRKVDIEVYRIILMLPLITSLPIHLFRCLTIKVLTISINVVHKRVGHFPRPSPQLTAIAQQQQWLSIETTRNPTLQSFLQLLDRCAHYVRSCRMSHSADRPLPTGVADHHSHAFLVVTAHLHPFGPEYCLPRL